jgi:hypothetical protein
MNSVPLGRRSREWNGGGRKHWWAGGDNAGSVANIA